MEDAAKRNKLFGNITKSGNLIERVIAWLQDALRKFKDFLRNPQGKLTTEQFNRLSDEFGRMATSLVDQSGNKIFRYNRRTHTLEFADVRELESVITGAKIKKSTNEEENVSPKETVKRKLLPLVGKPITNKATSIIALINVKQINEMLSNRAVSKSKNNGFTQDQHLEATGNIKQLYEDASLTLTRPDKKTTLGGQGLKSVKIFHCKTTVGSEKAVAKLTVKESFQHGHRVYSIELEELNKPAELENRTGTDSPAGSKGSTQKGNVSGARYAEEPSLENIAQTTGSGKIKYSINANDNGEDSLIQKARNKLASLLNNNKATTRHKEQITADLSQISKYRMLTSKKTGARIWRTTMRSTKRLLPTLWKTPLSATNFSATSRRAAT